MSLPSLPTVRERLRRLVGGRGWRAGVLLVAGPVWAAACYAAIELSQHKGGVGTVYERLVLEVPVVSLLGTLVVWVVLVLLWAATGRAVVAAALLAAAAGSLALANRTKLDLRLEPVLPSDVVYLAQPGFLAEMVGLRPVVALSVAALSGAVGAAGWWFRRRPGPRRVREPAGVRRPTSARWAAAVLCLSFLSYVGDFNEAGNGFRRAYDEAGADWAAWSQQRNYQRNGFVGGTLYNLDVEAMAEPPGYSEEAMREIVDRYSRQARRTNRDRSPDALADVNVVLVLSESFSDPTRLTGVRVAADPIPFTRGVMERTTSGTMLAQKFGGGTANMEFEVLTGMSLSQFSPQMTTPYQMLLPERSGFPSVVELMERDGHDSVAIHAYSSHMYRRESVYPVLGFDDFVSLGEMQSERTIEHSTKVSDEAAFEEALHHLDRSSHPLLVNLVTMQNHFPSRGSYDDPVRVRGVRGRTAEHAGGYVRGLTHSDAALERFLGELAGSEEKTAVVFYGDHLAPFWPERVRRLTGDIGIRSTPYFLWANFPLRRLPAEPLTSPVHFLPMLYDAAGAQQPPYYALLDRLHAHVPAMSPRSYLARDGAHVPESELRAGAARVLRDYRLVQYDLAVGHGYSHDGLFGPPLAQSAPCSHSSCP